MQILKPLACAFAALTLSCLAMTANAQEIPVPEDAGFAVRVELDAIRKTKLGKQLMTAIKTKAAEEIGRGKKSEDAFEDIEKALGFDPFDELALVSVFGRNLANPREGLQVVVEMGETTGNLEGLILALPGYESSRYEDYLIHSVAPKDDLRLYGAIHGSKTKRVVIGADPESVKSMLNALDERRSKTLSREDADAFVSVQLNEIPNIEDLDGPPEVIAKLLKQVSATIRQGSEDTLDIEINLTTDDEKHAEQLQQLTQGLTAMMALIQASNKDDDEVAMVAELVEGLSVERDGKSVQLRLEVPERLVVDFLREEAELPLSN